VNSYLKVCDLNGFGDMYFGAHAKGRLLYQGCTRFLTPAR